MNDNEHLSNEALSALDRFHREVAARLAEAYFRQLDEYILGCPLQFLHMATNTRPDVSYHTVDSLLGPTVEEPDAAS